MASDRAFRVRWSAGEIIVHGRDPKAAINVALEYLRVPEANRITAEGIIEKEMKAEPGD